MSNKFLDNVIIQKIKKDSLSLISSYENDLSSFLANKRQQEGLLIKNSTIFTISYARTYFSSSVSQFINILRESSDMQSATEYENNITRHIEDCALKYVQNIYQNLWQGEASITHDADYPLEITGNDVVLGKENSKFALDNGLDDYDAMSHQDCDNTTDLSTNTPKFKSGSAKANATPYMTVTTPCVGKRPMKSMSNFMTSMYTPDVNNNSTDNKSVKNKRNSWSYKGVKSHGRKRLSFSESKENVGFMTAVDLNDGNTEIKHNFLRPVLMDLKQLGDKNNFSDKCKFSVTKHSVVCSENKIKDSEKYDSSEDDSKNVDKHCSRSQKCKYFIENSRPASKTHLRSFIARNFYDGSDYLYTPSSGLNSIGNSFHSPQSLMGKRLDFSKPSSVLKKNVTKDFLSYTKKDITVNGLMTANKVVVKKSSRVLANTTAKESMLQLSAKECPLQTSNEEKKSCNISLGSKPYCSQMNKAKGICKINSVVNSVDNTLKCKKKVPRNFIDIDKDEAALTMNYQSPPPCKKCKVTLTQSLATPYPFMPDPSLNAPRKKRYSCRRSSPYCRRKLIKDFEALQIQAELMDTPPGSPVVG